MVILKKMGTVMTTLLVTCILGGTVSSVHADTYYENGVYCNKHTCHVDWGDAIGSIANNIVAGGWSRNGLAQIILKNKEYFKLLDNAYNSVPDDKDKINEKVKQIILNAA